MKWLALLIVLISPFLFSGENALFKVAVQCKLPSDMVIQNPRDVVTDRKGRVYLLDQSLRTIFVWDAKGNFLQTVGRKGQGPGEIALVDGVGCMAVNDNSLVVVDNKISKIHFWDSEFNFKKSIPQPAWLQRVTGLEAFGDKFAVISSNTNLGIQRLLLVNSDFDLIEELALVDDNLYSRNEKGRWDYRPFADTLVVGFGPNDIWYSNSNEHWVREVNLKGQTTREHRVPLVAVDLDPKETLAMRGAFNKWRKEGDTIAFPEKNNVIDILIPLEGNLIAISQYLVDDGRCKGVVIEKESGKIRGQFTHILGTVGFIAPLRGRIAAVTSDENDDFRLDIIKIVLEEVNENLVEP